MQLSRFWSSVWGVFAYLAGLAILRIILGRLMTLFGFVPDPWAIYLFSLATFVAMIGGTVLYIDWKWGWKTEHIGVGRSGGASAIGLLMGLVLGAVAFYLSTVATGWFSAGTVSFALPPVLSLDLLNLAVVLAIAFAVEFVFRGAVVSRFYADLSPREVLIAGTAAPFVWSLVDYVFGFLSLPTGIANVTWYIPLSIFLTLLFLRTDSVWISAGLRMGMVGAVALFGSVTAQGGTVVWGVAAAILVLLEFVRQQRMPRRVTPTRRDPRNTRSRTIRGPWGPH